MWSALMSKPQRNIISPSQAGGENSVVNTVTELALCHLFCDVENYSALFLADIPGSQLHVLFFLLLFTCTNSFGCCPPRRQLAAGTAPAGWWTSLGFRFRVWKWAQSQCLLQRVVAETSIIRHPDNSVLCFPWEKETKLQALKYWEGKKTVHWD